MAAELQAFAQELECQNSVEVIPDPSRQVKRRLFEEADIFVSLSDNLQETFGITLVEAMASELAIVASDWNGYKDLIQDGKNGRLVTTSFPLFAAEFDVLRGSGTLNVPDLLAYATVIDLDEVFGALDDLVSDPDYRHRLAAAAFETAKTTYSWPVIIAKYEELWGSLMMEAKISRYEPARERLDLEGYSYKNIFSHYPSAHITRETLVRKPELRDVINRSSVIKCVAQPPTWFSTADVDFFESTLLSRQASSVGELLDRASSQAGWSETKTLSFVARFAKYGLLLLETQKFL